MQEVHVPTLAKATAHSRESAQLRTACEFLIYTNVMSLVKMAASNRKNDEERESS